MMTYTPAAGFRGGNLPCRRNDAAYRVECRGPEGVRPTLADVSHLESGHEGYPQRAPFRGAAWVSGAGTRTRCLAVPARTHDPSALEPHWLRFVGARVYGHGPLWAPSHCDPNVRTSRPPAAWPTPSSLYLCCIPRVSTSPFSTYADRKSYVGTVQRLLGCPLLGFPCNGLLFHAVFSIPPPGFGLPPHQPASASIVLVCLGL